MSKSLASAVTRRATTTIRRSSPITSCISTHLVQRTSRTFTTRNLRLFARQDIAKSIRPANATLQALHFQRWSRKYSSENAPVFKQIGFDDINTAISASSSSTPSKIILVDVREPAELTATGIIPGAVSVPLGSQPDAYFLPPEEFKTRFGYAKPGFEQPTPGDQGKEKKQVIFYCRAGVRAQAAAQLAVQAGYDPETVGVYPGSWLDWEKNGGKIEKWEGNE